MRTLKVDANNDLMVGDDGNLAFLSGIDAVGQSSVQYVRARRGEMIHAMDEGIPYDTVAWGTGGANESQFEAVVRARLLQLTNVTAISSFTVRQVDDVLGYTATLVTDLGEVTING